MPCLPPPPDCASAYLATVDSLCLEQLGLLPGAAQPERSALAKEERDLFGTAAMASSANLVLRWDGGVSDAQAQAVLLEGEIAWSSLIQELGMPAPWQAQSSKLNIYVGDSGANAPRAIGDGYAWVDAQGYPMIVLDPSLLSDWGRGRTVLAHELFHTLQDNSPHPYEYSEQSPGAWLFEATAVWAEAEVYPDDPYTARWLYAWSLSPQGAVDGFVYPSGGALPEYRQYAAFAFLRDLTTSEGSALVVSLWTQAQDPDPRVELQSRLDLDAAWAGFSARAVSWDFPEGERYAQVHEQAAERWPELDARVAQSHLYQSDGWQQVLGTESLGTSYVVLYPDELEQDVRVRVRAPFEGTLQAVVVGEQVQVVPLGSAPVDALLEGAAEAQSVWLVASGPWQGSAEQEYGLEYRLESTSPGVLRDRGEQCGCGQGARAVLLLPLMLVFGWRRWRPSESA